MYVGTIRNSLEVVNAHMLDLVVRTDFNVQPRSQKEMCAPMILQSTITCPNCGGIKFETMPTNACQFFYDCAHCGVRLKPKAGDCCVFCSYGDVLCPPVQEAREKNEVCYCQDTAKITDRANNFERPKLPAHTAIDRSTSVMAMIL